MRALIIKMDKPKPKRGKLLIKSTIMFGLILLIGILLEIYILNFPSHNTEKRISSPQSIIPTNRGMVFEESGKPMYQGLQIGSSLSYNYDSPTFLFKEWEVLYLYNSKFSIYLSLQKQKYFNSLLLLVAADYQAPVIYYKTEIADFKLSPLPIYGKTIVNSTSFNITLGNFDPKYKDVFLTVPELDLELNAEVFKKTSENVLSINTLSQEGEKFEYAYQDGNKLITGYAKYQGIKHEMSGSHGFVEWYRAEHNYKSFRISAIFFGNIENIQVTLSLGGLQEDFLNATSDSVYIGKKVVKLGAAHFSELIFNMPINVTTEVFNSTKVDGVFYPQVALEQASNFYFGRSKHVLVPGSFSFEIKSWGISGSFTFNGLIHIRASSLLI